MTLIRACLGIAVIELIGIAVFTLLTSDMQRWTSAAKFGLSFCLGLVTLTLSLFIGSWCGLKPVWWFGVCEAILLGVLAFLFRKEQVREFFCSSPEKTVARRAPWMRIVEVGALIFIAVTIALVSGVSLLEPLVEWDVIAIWAFKAKVLFHESVAATPYFQDVTKAFSHLDYPLLWPITMTWIWACVGDTDLESLKLLSPALLLALAATFYGILRRCVSSFSALLFTALLFGVPMVLSQTARLMTDVPLGLFVLSGFGCFYLWIRDNHSDDLKLAGLFATGMLFIKNEGIGFFVIFLVAAITLLAVQRKARRIPSVALWVFVVPMTLTALWFVFRANIPKVHEDYASRLSPKFFFEEISRFPEVLKGTFHYCGNTYDWLGFWALFLLVIVFCLPLLIKPPQSWLSLIVCLSFAMYGYIFVVSPWPVKDLLETAANRLLLHLTPLCAFLMAELSRAAGLLPRESEPNPENK